MGPAWFDYPSAVDTAHAPAECSNRGTCDRILGTCACETGFEGASRHAIARSFARFGRRLRQANTERPRAHALLYHPTPHPAAAGDACERSSCPGLLPSGATCSGHGTCKSIAQLAATAAVNGELVSPQYTYGVDATVVHTWDAAASWGCQCDANYGGYDCSAALCPSGEDPAARDLSASVVDEVQALTCTTLPGMAGSPTFTLQFRDKQTGALAYNADADTVAAALSALSTVVDATVVFTVAGSSTTATAACAAAPGTTMTITFNFAHGDVPPVRVVMSGQDATTLYWAAGSGWTDTQLSWAGGNPATAPDFSWGAAGFTYAKGGLGFVPTGVRGGEVVKGTSVSSTCAARGVCDSNTGTCKCFTGYGSSDGMRGSGGVGDCGFREPW